MVRFGKKFKHKGNLFMVTDETTRTVKARRIFNIDKQYNPSGSVSNVVTTIKKKDLNRILK